MKALLAVATLLAALPALAQPTLAQPADPRPDLAITNVTTSASRVVVGETFTYTVTTRNNGRAPCNWVNISMALPGTVNLIGTSSSAPLSCEPLIHVVGQPLVEICRGGPGYFLWPGGSLTTTYTVRALSVASGVTATATVDPGNVCRESRESNNTGTSPPSTFFKRPRLKMSLNRPGPATGGGGRGIATQVFPVTVTNIGEGPAIDVALAVSFNHGPVAMPLPAYPELLTVYKSALVPEGGTLPPSIPPACSVFDNPDTFGRICSFRVTLQPMETLQARYRFVACPTGVFPGLASHIGASTVDDIAQDSDHSVSLHRACHL
ncbi:MAG: CARDB domain-containing protein [Reyranella sp.]|nr:CARDB domain-containing protein [Reyranella sp.]